MPLSLKLSVNMRMGAGPVFVSFKNEDGVVYKLDRAHATALLAKLDGFGEDCSIFSQHLREKLRAALLNTTNYQPSL